MGKDWRGEADRARISGAIAGSRCRPHRRSGGYISTQDHGAIITELLSAALDTLEAALPYEQGERIIAEDECGDPIYEDIGPTPRFLRLAKQHAARLAEESEGGGG